MNPWLTASNSKTPHTNSENCFSWKLNSLYDRRPGNTQWGIEESKKKHPLSPILKTPSYFTSKGNAKRSAVFCAALLSVTITITVPQKHGFLSLSVTSRAFAGEFNYLGHFCVLCWSCFSNLFFFFSHKSKHIWLFYWLLLPAGCGAARQKAGEASAERRLWEGWESWDQDKWCRKCIQDSLMLLLKGMYSLQIISPVRNYLVTTECCNFLPIFLFLIARACCLEMLFTTAF